MKVKIKQGVENQWYEAGEEFEVEESQSSSRVFVVTKGESKGSLIKRSHVELIQEQTVQKSNTEYDNVTKPLHYHKNGLDPITIMKYTFTKEEYAGFCKGNVLKYNQRYKEKGGADDLKKALFYQNELIAWEGE